MAMVKSIFLYVLLLAVAVNSVEGRHLKTGKTKESNEKPITPGEKIETVARKGGESISALHGEDGSKTTAYVADELQAAVAPLHVESSPEPASPDPVKDPRSPSHGHLDDFRPTDPGHSPGIGHSVHN